MQGEGNLPVNRHFVNRRILGGFQPGFGNPDFPRFGLHHWTEWIEEHVQLRLIKTLLISHTGGLLDFIGVIQQHAKIANPAHAGFRTHCRLAGLDARITEDALLRLAGIPVVVNFLVRATRYAHPPAPAFVLIDQHNAVFLALVNRPAGTGGDTGRIQAVFAQARQIHHEGIFKFAVNLLLHILKVVVFGTLGEFGAENFFPVWPPVNLLHPFAANRRTGAGHRHGFRLWRILQMGVVVIPRLVIIINRRQIGIGEDVG